VSKASAKFLQTTAKAVQRCHDMRLKGQLAANTDCSADPGTVTKINAYRTRLASQVRSACGGADKACGTGDDAPLASYGWGSVTQCPTFDGSACTAPIANCNDVITCVSCLDQHAVTRSLTQAVGSANSAAFGTSSPANRCQRMIGKGTSKYEGSVAKVMSKCWDARLRGQHSNACPVPGDGKAGAALAKAEQKKVSTICKSCGGADHACNGTGDLAVSDIGFPASCPAVTVPGGDACAGAVTTLSQLVTCVDCVAEFETRCADAVAVPGLIALPAQCGGV